MKKLKKLLPAFIAVALAFVMVFAVACNGSCGGNGDDNPPVGGGGEVTTTLSSIEVDYDNAKTTYLAGEAYSSEGLVVTANYSNSDGTTTRETVALSDPNLVIDDHEFVSAVSGEYAISLSYTKNGVTKSTSYNVTVVKTSGAHVTLKSDIIDGVTLNEDKTIGQIKLSQEQPTVTIDPTQIEVRKPNNKGEVDLESQALSSSDYTVKVYKNAEEVTTLTDLSAGVYEINVTLKEQVGGFIVKAFALIYVINDLASLTWNSSAEGTLTEQTASSTDSISSTWKFTAAYANGDTKDVTEDVVLSGVETKTAGENKTATATYTEANAKGEEISKTADVTYTINQAGGTAKTESFLVPDAAVPEAQATITAGSNIEDNSLFTVTASGDMVYSIGKNATEGVGNSSKAVTAQLLDGSSKTFVQGLKQKDATKPNASETVETGASVTITAKANVTLRVYVGLANDGFNSDRAGSIKYTVTGGEAQTSAIAKREKIATIEVTLTEGQTLTLVGVLNVNADDSKSGKLWLFGVEAQGEGGSAPAGASESFLVPDTAVPEAEATITAGTNIEDNSLFTVTASGDMIYSIGKDASAGVGNSSKAVTAQLLDGSSKTFLQGLKQKDATTPDAAEKVETSSKITITAKETITVRIYAGLANDSFNSDRAGEIKYVIADGEAQSVAVKKREQIATIEVTLTAGQTLTISGVLDVNADDSKTAKLWLFGVEAKTN